MSRPSCSPFSLLSASVSSVLIIITIISADSDDSDDSSLLPSQTRIYALSPRVYTYHSPEFTLQYPQAMRKRKEVLFHL
ncbi:hypothetical protein SCHPADRAFT_906039 [Schizopora paradoxa]|uniref:Secreted protein n=1 Tax=Schizopora paradoxa TaxID=27342 RepID=A0A0H2RIJ0_9AGAM|nr:hypothetical protein SCHPADRAFT_906039 [Schizopora paradoxa]